MNILILGSGGREHTLAWKISQSSLCSKLYVAPGNAGTLEIAENISIDFLDFPELGHFCTSHNIDFIIVGPEVPLVQGVVDYFKNTPELSSIKILGPDKKGALLEGSKDFSKGFMEKYSIPTASSKTFSKNTISDGLQYLNDHALPIVLKADGLAAGKGVIISDNRDEAKATLKEMLEDNKFGEASQKVVIEEYLPGIELSVFVLTDGTEYVLLPEAKDYKRIGENDTGLNTGGMGAVSPVPFADQIFMSKVKSKVIEPTLEGLQKEGIKYVGFIFFGLMNVHGEPFVIEYNARLGDPETEVIIPRISEDFLQLCILAVEGKLKHRTAEIIPQTATTVMLVAGGYPEDYQKGDRISGLENIHDIYAFHAGTKLLDSKIVTNGGRVISLTGIGNSIDEALAKCNRAASQINFNNKYFRRDIGKDLLSMSDPSGN